MGTAENDFEIRALPDDSALEFALAWDFVDDDPVDLDCSALCFDSMGVVQDAVFYNNRTAFAEALVHSGDSRKGEEDSYDETIRLRLHALPRGVAVIAFVVNAFSGGTFRRVEAATADVNEVRPDGRVQLSRLHVGCGAGSTGCVFALLHRAGLDSGAWRLRRVAQFCEGRTFSDSLPAVRAAVDRLIDPGLRQERTLSMDKTFRMSKGDVVEIPPALFTGSYDLYVGLGWTCDAAFDLDASVVVTDGRGGLRQFVWYRNRRYRDAIVHRGDNVTGAGAGDDERIDIDLDRLPPEALELVITVNIYTRWGDFGRVRDAYVRLAASKTDHELCRFALSDATVRTNGLVFATLRRVAGTNVWTLSARGDPCEGRRVTDPGMRAACGLAASPGPPADEKQTACIAGGVLAAASAVAYVLQLTTPPTCLLLLIGAALCLGSGLS